MASSSIGGFGKLIHRDRASQAKGATPKVQFSIDHSEGLGSDSASFAGGPSSKPFLSDENIEAKKDEILDILDPAHSPEGTVSDRLDRANARIMGWETDSTNPKLAATARYYLAAQQGSRTLFYGSNALRQVGGRADVQSVPVYETTHGLLQLAAGAASAAHVPGASLVLTLIDKAVSAYSHKKDFNDIHNTFVRVLKQDEIEPFSESLALFEALANMGTLGTKEERIRNAPDPKGKINRRPAEIKKEEKLEEDLAAEDTYNAIKDLAFGNATKASQISREHVRRLREMTTEAKVIEALCRVNIKCNERMVVCRPSTTKQLNVLGEQSNVQHEQLNAYGEQWEMHDERLNVYGEQLEYLTKSMESFNQNPWEETVPAYDNVVGYSQEEKKAAKKDVAILRAEKKKAKAEFENIVGLFHPFDKKAAEKIYGKARRALDRAKAKPAYLASLDDSSSDDAADVPIAPLAYQDPLAAASAHVQARNVPQANVTYPYRPAPPASSGGYAQASDYGYPSDPSTSRPSLTNPARGTGMERDGQSTVPASSSIPTARIYYPDGGRRAAVMVGDTPTWVDELPPEERTSLGINQNPQASFGGAQSIYPAPRYDDGYDAEESRPGPSTSRRRRRDDEIAQAGPSDSTPAPTRVELRQRELREWEAEEAVLKQSKLRELEEAVEAERAKLKVRTRDRVPLDWARTKHNLGLAFYKLGKREVGTAYLEKAVEAFYESLEVRTRDSVPFDWAMTKENLGRTFYRLGEREAGTAYLEKAVEAFHESLEVRTRDSVPFDWAMTKDHLGLAFYRLGEREAGTMHLEKAAEAFRDALMVRTRELVPFDWEKTRHHLVGVFYKLGNGPVSTWSLVSKGGLESFINGGEKKYG